MPAEERGLWSALVMRRTTRKTTHFVLRGGDKEPRWRRMSAEVEKSPWSGLCDVGTSLGWGLREERGKSLVPSETLAGEIRVVPCHGLPHLHFLGQWTGLLEITFPPSLCFRRSHLSPALVCNPSCLSGDLVKLLRGGTLVQKKTIFRLMGSWSPGRKGRIPWDE